MAIHRIDNANHLFSGAPNNMPSTTYAAGRNLPSQNSYSAQSIRNSNLRREAIKSENFKDPVVVCPVCKMKLSTETEECPNCNHKVKKVMSDFKRSMLLVILALAILLIPYAKNNLPSFEEGRDYLQSFFEQAENFFEDFIES